MRWLVSRKPLTPTQHRISFGPVTDESGEPLPSTRWTRLYLDQSTRSASALTGAEPADDKGFGCFDECANFSRAPRQLNLS